eukprot:403333652
MDKTFTNQHQLQPQPLLQENDIGMSLKSIFQANKIDKYLGKRVGSCLEKLQANSVYSPDESKKNENLNDIEPAQQKPNCPLQNQQQFSRLLHDVKSLKYAFFSQSRELSRLISHIQHAKSEKLNKENTMNNLVQNKKRDLKIQQKSMTADIKSSSLQAEQSSLQLRLQRKTQKIESVEQHEKMSEKHSASGYSTSTNSIKSSPNLSAANISYENKSLKDAKIKMSSADLSGHDIMSTDCGKSPIDSYQKLNSISKESFTFDNVEHHAQKFHLKQDKPQLDYQYLYKLQKPIFQTELISK